MADSTTNYNLTKPASTDTYNIDDFNNNADIIDTQMKANADKADAALPASDFTGAQILAKMEADNSVLPVENGGTNANNATEACDNIGAPKMNGCNTYASFDAYADLEPGHYHIVYNGLKTDDPFTYTGNKRVDMIISSNGTSTPSKGYLIYRIDALNVRGLMYVGMCGYTADSVSWAQIMDLNTAVNIFANPNLLINGDFQVWQRGTSFTGVASNTYTLDRWRTFVLSAGETLTIEKQTDSNLGNIVHLKGEVTDGSIVNFGQIIEANKKNENLTLSFYIKGSENISAGCIVNGSSYDSGTKTYAVTTSWERKSITFTNVTPDTSYIYVNIFRGANFGTKEVWIAQPKLELGSVATPFMPRPYGEELALCKRYYQRYSRASSVDMWLDTLATEVHSGYAVAHFNIPEMRVAPTIIDNDAFQTRLITSDILSGTTTYEFGAHKNMLTVSAVNTAITTSMELYNIGTYNTDGYVELDAEI